MADSDGTSVPGVPVRRRVTHEPTPRRALWREPVVTVSMPALLGFVASYVVVAVVALAAVVR